MTAATTTTQCLPMLLCVCVCPMLNLAQSVQRRNQTRLSHTVRHTVTDLVQRSSAATLNSPCFGESERRAEQRIF